jgi:signal transduction histidine kinase
VTLQWLGRRIAGLQPSRRSATLSATPQSRRIIFLISGAAFIAAAVLASSAALVWQLRQDAFSNATGNIEKINLVLAEQTSRTLQSIDLVAADLLRDIHSREYPRSAQFREGMETHEVHLQLRQRIAGMPQLEALALIDAEGDVFNITGTFPAPEVNVVDRDYYNALRGDSKLVRFISSPVLNRMTGSWTIYLARRINAPDGSFIGIVAAVMVLDHFEQFYQQIYLGKDTGVALWRTDGTLLARYPSGVMTGTPNKKSLANHMEVLAGGNSQSGTGRVVGTVNPTPLLLTLRRVQGYELYTAIAMPETAILASWRTTSAYIIGGGIMIAIAIGVIAWLLMKQFAAHQLTMEARAQRDQATASLKQVEAISRAKSDFLAHMSHELRTPLNAIIGFAELMKEELMGPMSQPQYRTYCGDIHASGLNLLGIVNDVLDFSQANVGKLTVERRPVDLAGVIGGLKNMFRVQVAKAGLTLSTDIPPALPPVWADEKRLKQVLINLVGNAVKFTPHGGSVRVAAHAAGDRVIISVADTGIGIPRENLPNLFEPFGELTLPHVAQKNRGAGLGLPICKQLVELLGGTLKLESQLNAGTVVTVALQAAPPPPAGYALAAE